MDIIKKILKYIAGFAAVTGAIIMFFNQSYSSAGYSREDSKMKSIESSSQYNDNRFENKSPWSGMGFKENAGVMWDFMKGGDQRVPKTDLPVQPVELDYFHEKGKNQLHVTWLGHSSLMINIDGFKIMTDPVFEKKVSIAGPTRFNGEVPLDPSQLTQVDVVIISHNHYDHLNKSSILALKDITDVFVAPLVVGAQLEKWGVSRDKIVELDWWDEYRFQEDLMIAATPAQHFSGRGLTDRNKTLWASWVIRGPEHQVFFSGDSGYFGGFKEIGETYGPFDMTFLECGAYNKTWHSIHMYPEETVQAHLDLKGDILMPIHWATFNLAMHSWFEPAQRMYAAAGKAQVKTATPVVGETIRYGTSVPEVPWWEDIAKHNQ